MAIKRKVVEPPTGTTVQPQEQGAPPPPRRSEWVREELARRYYYLLCLAIDVFVPLQILQWVPGLAGFIVVLVFLTIAILAEFYVHRRLWPREME
ncbi:MAG: hypothetical protein NT137_06635 [Methanomassiliicoccales archaeon]|nr:hypothetical protein [Methanomassiliicoccales archaeon]